jgi:hypothetical protein
MVCYSYYFTIPLAKNKPTQITGVRLLRYLSNCGKNLELYNLLWRLVGLNCFIITFATPLCKGKR